LGPNSLVMGSSDNQTSFSIDPDQGLVITQPSNGGDPVVTTISPDGTLSTPQIVASSAILPAFDAINDIGTSLGSTDNRFTTLFLGPNSLVMGSSDNQTSFSTDPNLGFGNGMQITASSTD